MMPNRAALLVTIAVAAVTVGLTGCSSEQKKPDPSAFVEEQYKLLQALGDHENAKLLENGTVTHGDYYLAAERFKSCFSDFGIALGGPFVDPVDGQYLQWAYPEEYATAPGVAEPAEACIKSWEPVMASYLATHEPIMDQLLKKEVGSCLSKAGHAVKGDEVNAIDFAGEDAVPKTDRARAFEQCVFDLVPKLFPNIPGTAINY